MDQLIVNLSLLNIYMEMNICIRIKQIQILQNKILILLLILSQILEIKLMSETGSRIFRLRLQKDKNMKVLLEIIIAAHHITNHLHK